MPSSATRRIACRYSITATRSCPTCGHVYRGVYARHQQEPEQAGFGDIVFAQQNLASAVGDYITFLNGQWTALADIANLMQVEEFGEIYTEKIPAGPELKLPNPMP